MENGNSNEEWHARLRKLIPFASSTCTKAARLVPEEPTVIVRGRGCRVWDADGREFIDFRNSLGPISLGYCHPAVDEAIRRQLDLGIAFGHPHPIEAEVAELFVNAVPCAEQARFLKTGGEAIAACIRLARAFAKRDHIIQIGYNGWLNSIGAGASTMTRLYAESIPLGVPQAVSELHHPLPWGDIEGVERLLREQRNDVAAIIVAADYAEMEAAKTFLPPLRKLANKYGTVLIFDEVVTGFRIAKGGIQEHYSVIPDLAVFAKGIANGMPLSVYCGRRDILRLCEKGVFITSTLGGETLSLAAARAVFQFMEDHDVIGHLWRQGEAMWSGLNKMFAERGIPAEMKGAWPCVTLVTAKDAPPKLADNLHRAAFKHGISLGPVCYVNYSHSDQDIAEALERMERALKELE